LPGFSLAYKRRIKELYPTGFELSGYGEGLPFDWNSVEIDPGGLRDRLGIPQVRFHTKAEAPRTVTIKLSGYKTVERKVVPDGKPVPIGLNLEKEPQ